MEDALYEIESMRRFARLELADDALPDETTILNFRRLLERHDLTAQLMNTINDWLEEKGLLLKGGTMVDATIIHAPPSTKNQAKVRDPEMHQTQKGKQWCFCMKVHVGADIPSGVAHTVSVTPANGLGPQPIAGSAAGRRPDGSRRRRLRQQRLQAGRPESRRGLGRGPQGAPEVPTGLPQRRRNRKMSGIRNRVEHIFRTVKRQFGYTKARYRGLAKNAAQVFTLIGLTNLYLQRHALMN